MWMNIEMPMKLVWEIFFTGTLFDSFTTYYFARRMGMKQFYHRENNGIVRDYVGRFGVIRGLMIVQVDPELLFCRLETVVALGIIPAVITAIMGNWDMVLPRFVIPGFLFMAAAHTIAGIRNMNVIKQHTAQTATA